MTRKKKTTSHKEDGKQLPPVDPPRSSKTTESSPEPGKSNVLLYVVFWLLVFAFCCSSLLYLLQRDIDLPDSLSARFFFYLAVSCGVSIGVWVVLVSSRWFFSITLGQETLNKLSQQTRLSIGFDGIKLDITKPSVTEELKQQDQKYTQYTPLQTIVFQTEEYRERLLGQIKKSEGKAAINLYVGCFITFSTLFFLVVGLYLSESYLPLADEIRDEAFSTIPVSKLVMADRNDMRLDSDSLINEYFLE